MKFKCAWCNNTIKSNREMFTLSAEFASGVNYSEPGGKIDYLYFSSRKKKSMVIYTGAESDAKKAGQDMLFPVCSQKCGSNFREVLQEELQNFNNIQTLY